MWCCAIVIYEPLGVEWLLASLGVSVKRLRILQAPYGCVAVRARSIRILAMKVVVRLADIRPVIVWSGVVAGKIVYDILGSCGVNVSKGGFFRVSPLYHGDEPVRRGSILNPGEVVWFNVAFWGREGEEAARTFVACTPKAPEGFTVESVEARMVELKLPEPGEAVKQGEPVAFYYRVVHQPTFYRFHGAVVAYPSPRRMIAYLARLASQLTGLDYRGAAARLAESIELVYWKGRTSIYDIGGGRRQAAFNGEARYYGVAEEPLYRLLDALMSLASVAGLGGSPGIGFGWVEKVEPGEPPFEPPVPIVATRAPTRPPAS